MKQLFTLKGRVPFKIPLLFLFSVILLFGSCKKFVPEQLVIRHFDQENLVGSNDEYNPVHIDPTLVNAWGIAFTPTGIPWVNANGGHVSEIYDAEGVILRPPVWIPGPGVKTPGTPTGIVFNPTSDFWLSNGKSAKFIFVGNDGILSGWNPDAGNYALLIKNNSSTSAYTGLAISKWGGANYIYASNFKTGKIDTWDKHFNKVWWNFKDPGVPSGYSPFNIQAVGDWLYVMYAKVGPTGDEEKGAGLGYVSIFKPNGNFVKRFASKGALNAPWGIAHASADFFRDNEDDMFVKAMGADHGIGIRDMVLVGNFGDGRINAYTEDGKFIGPLKSHGKPIEIEGLWAIMFPPSSATKVDPNRLYFASGPDEEKNGLFGYIQKQ